MKRWRLYIIIAVGAASFAAATAYFVFIAPGRRIKANEAVAISALRTIVSAQELYKTMTSPGYGDCFELNNGKGSRYIKPELAAADPDNPEHEPLNGYTIDISLGPPPWPRQNWCAIARPVRWGIDGERNFKITSDGVIWYNETEGDTTNFLKVLGGD